MKKYSITVSTEFKALKINRMIENRSQWDKEPVFEGYPLHAGINYTTDPLVYECAKKMESLRHDIVWAEPIGKDFDIRNEFSKFRFVNGFSVFLGDPSDVYFNHTLYYRKKELVNIAFNSACKSREYMVYINCPYYENGELGFVERKDESIKQHVFLETRSAKIAFNMVNRIVANMRYPKEKYIW